MEIHTVINERWTATAGTLLNSYQLMAYPDALTGAGISAEQQYLVRRYQATLPPQPTGIMVAQFMAREDMESTLIRWMHRIISSQQSFRVSMSGFGALSSGQIYLRVQEQQPFQELATALQVVDQYVRSYDCPPVKRYTHPYLPLTGKVSNHVFGALEAEYAARQTDLSFEVKELLLIRCNHEQEKGRQINVFRLQPAS
jgi:2'-5' RNA ligase